MKKLYVLCGIIIVILCFSKFKQMISEGEGYYEKKYEDKFIVTEEIPYVESTLMPVISEEISETDDVALVVELRTVFEGNLVSAYQFDSQTKEWRLINNCTPEELTDLMAEWMSYKDSFNIIAYGENTELGGSRLFNEMVTTALDRAVELSKKDKKCSEEIGYKLEYCQ